MSCRICVTCLCFLIAYYVKYSNDLRFNVGTCRHCQDMILSSSEFTRPKVVVFIFIFYFWEFLAGRSFDRLS